MAGMSFAGLSIGWSFCGYLAVVIAMAALLHHLRGMPRAVVGVLRGGFFRLVEYG